MRKSYALAAPVLVGTLMLFAGGWNLLQMVLGNREFDGADIYRATSVVLLCASLVAFILRLYRTREETAAPRLAAVAVQLPGALLFESTFVFELWIHLSKVHSGPQPSPPPLGITERFVVAFDEESLTVWVGVTPVEKVLTIPLSVVRNISPTYLAIGASTLDKTARPAIALALSGQGFNGSLPIAVAGNSKKIASARANTLLPELRAKLGLSPNP